MLGQICLPSSQINIDKDNFFFPKSKEQLNWKNKEFLTILLFYDGHEKLDGKQADKGSIDESTYLWGIYLLLLLLLL